MKEVEKKLKEDAEVVLKALHDSVDEEIMISKIMEIDKVLNCVSYANALLTLSFVLGKVLSEGTNLSNYEKEVTLYALHRALKTSVLIWENDDEDN